MLATSVSFNKKNNNHIVIEIYYLQRTITDEIKVIEFSSYRTR